MNEINSVKRFFLGFGALFRGISLIKNNKKLFKMTIIPFLINLIVLVLLFTYSDGRISGWVENSLSIFFSNKDSFFWSLFYWPSFVFAWLVFLALLFFLGYVLASILASPFNSLLAEETLFQQKTIVEKNFYFKDWFSLFVKMLWTSILKAVLFLLIAVVIFVLSFIPVVSIAASFMLLLIMAFDSADYSFEAMAYTLKERINFFKKHIACFSGIGLALGLTLWIPGLNFVLFPAAVVGGADLIGKLIVDEPRSESKSALRN